MKKLLVILVLLLSVNDAILAGYPTNYIDTDPFYFESSSGFKRYMHTMLHRSNTTDFYGILYELNPYGEGKWLCVGYKRWIYRSPWTQYVYPWDGDVDALLNSNDILPTGYYSYIGLVADMAEKGDFLTAINAGPITDMDIFQEYVDLFFLDIFPDQAPPDAPYKNPINSTEMAEPVFMSNGEFSLSATDLSVQGRGLSLGITRTYGSRREYNSRFGYGWDMNFNMKIRKLSPIENEPNVVVLLDGGGYKREYVNDVNDPNYFDRQDDYSDYLYYDGNTFTLMDKSGIEYGFDTNGCLSTIKDKNGNQFTFTYDPNGLLPIYGRSKFCVDENGAPIIKYGLISKEYMLKAITDDLGRQMNFTYDSNGLLSTITDFTDRMWTYTYDATTNDLLSVEDPNENKITYTYNLYNNNLISIIDANNQTYLTNDYDAYDRVESQDYGYGTFVFDYNSVETKGVLTDRQGYQTEIIYTDSGQIKTETVYTDDPNSDPNSFVTEYFYNSNNLVIRQILPNGSCIDYTYNGNGDVTGIYKKISPDDANDPDDPNVIAMLFTYDNTHIYDINSITDPMSNVTTFEYDPNGNITKIIYPAVFINGQQQYSTVEYTYNSHGQVETVISADGIVTKYLYYDDSNPDDPNRGRLWKVIMDANESDQDRLEITTEYRYDIYGNTIEIKDPNGDSSIFQYNELNQLTKSISPSPFNYVTDFYYNNTKKLAQIERVRTGDNQIINYSYDILDHVKTVTDPCGYVTLYGYNLNEEPNIVTDAETNNTVSVYNERGLLWKVTDANNNITEYSYDNNGNLKQIEDPKGNITLYNYDGFGRLICVTYPDDTNEVFAYDKNSNLISEKNRTDETIYYEYDALKRLVVKNRPSEPNITFLYNIAGRLLDIDDRGNVTQYSYDRIGRVSDINDPEDRLVSYEYDNRGLRTRLTYPDDSYINYEYDAMSRLTKITDDSNNLLAQYQYDELSRRTLVTLGNDSNAVYEYDLTNRLTKLTNNIDDSNAITFEYGNYDKVGNRLSMKVDDENAHTYTYDNLYQLTFVDYNDSKTVSYSYDSLGNRTNVNDGSSTIYSRNNVNQYTSVGGTNYSYDNNGNLTNDGSFKYYYDCENRLTDVNDQNNNAVASYEYDYSGRRTKKTVYGSPDIITKYCYDGDQVIAEYDDSNNFLRKFIYGPGIDEPICMIDVDGGDKVYYYHFDGLGSVVALSDVNNVIVERYSYDVFGAPTIYDVNNSQISQSVIGNPYMFTARSIDHETGLYYYRARMYNSVIGRFLQTDPIGYEDGINVYAYCGNNPVNFADPMGLCKGESSFGRKLWEGDYVGAQYGDSALDRYAREIAFGNASWYNYVGAAFSALWTPESWKSTAITLGTAGYSAVQARLAASSAKVAGTGIVRGGFKPVQIGRAGERAVGINGPKNAINWNGQKLIPDQVTKKLLVEVKNVKNLSFTKQLRNYSNFAQTSNRNFELYVRSSTKLSGPLHAARESGSIIIKYIPGM